MQKYYHSPYVFSDTVTVNFCMNADVAYKVSTLYFIAFSCVYN